MKKPFTAFVPEPSHAALVVMDIQDRLVAAMPDSIGQQISRNANILATAAIDFEIPVLLTEQYSKGLGPTVLPLHETLAQMTPIEKTAFNCCQVPAFQLAMLQVDRHDIILCGIETHVCVLQTAMDLLEQGKRVFVVADATASRTRMNWQFGIDLLRQAGAVVVTTEILVFGILGSAGTERFKRLSKLIK